ncbi:MAG TPA: endonuclease/exonuclease/phosphatase family protein [Myxococcaceae bacterium]|nr:endonuclease/exonuclease/phosphatase family protein [Myxococcaceae bacterium]
MLRTSPALCLLVLLPLVAGCPSREPDATRGPSIVTEVLPSARVGVPYATTIEAEGGSPSLDFSVRALPSGFSFYLGSGRLEGVPRQPGIYALTFTVRDAWGREAERTLPLEVAPADPVGEDDAFLDIVNWNIEWFGAPERGPHDEEAQLRGVAQVIGEEGADIWALLEVVDPGHFDALLDRLNATSGSEWEGLLGGDPIVAGGPEVYGPDWLKPALIWRRGALKVRSAEIILRGSRYAFGSRPPLRVDADVTAGGVTTPITFVVIHLAPFAEPDAHASRAAAGRALQSWLDAQPEDAEIIVLGDWNDDLDASILIPWESPFAELVAHPRHVFLTEVLSFNKVSTTVNYAEPIDHQLATACLAKRALADGTVSTRPTLPSYGTHVSDHYPVRSRFRFSPTWHPCP